MTSVAGSTARVSSDRGVGRGLSAWFGHGWWRGPVPVTLAIAGVLHVVWATLLATSGGDIAAQDAWAEFARAHPDVAYDLGWYGGMHPVSYSVISPYIMAWAGVRTTMVVAGTLSAGLIAWLIQRSGQVTRPMWPSAYAAVALFGNAISGRVTFALGVLLALTAIALVTIGRDQEAAPRRHLLRTFAAVSTGLATAASPVAGLFLGLIAAALWLTRRRPDAYALGVPPVVVVLASAVLFRSRASSRWRGTRRSCPSSCRPASSSSCRWPGGPFVSPPRSTPPPCSRPGCCPRRSAPTSSGWACSSAGSC